MKQFYLLLSLIALLVLSLATAYTMGKNVVEVELSRLQGHVDQQAKQAKQDLERLTQERDKKQAAIDKLAKEQEAKDNAAKNQIDKLSSDLANRPIRVRIEAESGCSDCSATGEAASDTNNSESGARKASGLLSKENSERLRRALEEVELLSAAFNSCKQTLQRF